jgi:hypothetical protein
MGNRASGFAMLAMVFWGVYASDLPGGHKVFGERGLGRAFLSEVGKRPAFGRAQIFWKKIFAAAAAAIF